MAEAQRKLQAKELLIPKKLLGFQKQFRIKISIQYKDYHENIERNRHQEKLERREIRITGKENRTQCRWIVRPKTFTILILKSIANIIPGLMFLPLPSKV